MIGIGDMMFGHLVAPEEDVIGGMAVSILIIIFTLAASAINGIYIIHSLGHTTQQSN